MPLHWKNFAASRLCIVSGHGIVMRRDIERYLAATLQQGVKGYAKLVDLTAGTLALDADDVRAVAQGLVMYGWGERAGPVAMVVADALNLDMALLLKQRVGNRPFRIFTSSTVARSWLASYDDGHRAIDWSAPPAGRPLRPLRAV